MIIATATIYSFSALLLIMIVTMVYFSIFYMIFYVILWGIAEFIRPILKILNHE